VFAEHADAAEISRANRTRRRHDSGKRDRDRLMKGEPPLSVIEFWYRSAIEECQSVKVGERVGDFVIMPVDLPNPVPAPQTFVR
jgi:hypothetical protein